MFPKSILGIAGLALLSSGLGRLDTRTNQERLLDRLDVAERRDIAARERRDTSATYAAAEAKRLRRAARRLAITSKGGI